MAGSFTKIYINYINEEIMKLTYQAEERIRQKWTKTKGTIVERHVCNLSKVPLVNSYDAVVSHWAFGYLPD